MGLNQDILSYTPERSTDLLFSSQVSAPMDKSVIAKTVAVNHVNHLIRKSLMWGSFNAVLFSVVCYDLIQRCPMPWAPCQNTEIVFAIILFFNTVYHMCCYIYYQGAKHPVKVTKSQRRLLGYSNDDTSFVITTKSKSKDTSLKLNCSPNLTAFSFDRSWKDDSAFHTSTNDFYVSATNRSIRQSPSETTIPPYVSTPNSKSPVTPLTTIGVDLIKDELTLDQYLKHYDVVVENSAGAEIPDHSTASPPIWSHPSSVEPEQSQLANNQYQLAYTDSENNRNHIKDKGSPLLQYGFGYVEFWKKRHVNLNTLPQWVDNLRVWISSTILIRLAKEINTANEYFSKHGHSDLRVGSSALDRLRKSAASPNGPPTLSALIPFLDFSSNQEYLVCRIKELAKSRCISDFRWNSGALHFNGKLWNSTLPTDCAIIMHLFATYLDSQLVPLPQQPDGKPFTTQYLTTNTSEKPVRIPGKFKIHQTEMNPPNYILVTETGIHETPKGRNNLFHTILLFLLNIKLNHHGMLGRVNLGPAGINIMWVIDDNE